MDRFLAKYRAMPGAHVTRVLGCWVAISDGRILEIDRTDALEYCPLQRRLGDDDVEGYVLEKIRRFGQFSASREIARDSIAVPFGASEMLMYALRKDVIDCAVTVCDGAGTVATDRPEIVQGIGARMNGLFHTSPIPAVLGRLRKYRCVVFDDAAIDQGRGCRAALDRGYRRIGVTVNLCRGDNLWDLRAMESRSGARLTIAGICSTGTDDGGAAEAAANCDLAWSCASGAMRRTGARALVQVTIGIPIFVYTQRGLRLLGAYSDEDGAAAISKLCSGRQYLLSGGSRRATDARKIRLGSASLYLVESRLPVCGMKEPSPLR